MINVLFTKTPLMFFVQSFWSDEAFSYLMAKKSLLDIVVLSAKDFSPPLYYFSLHFWMNVFGTSEVMIRLLSVIFYWATIYVCFIFLSDFFKMKLKKAFFYTFFIAINPILLYYAFEARMYSMFAFFSVLSFYALYKKNDKLYLLAAVLGLYTHYFMVFVVILQYFMSKSKQLKAFAIFLPWGLYTLISKGVGPEPFWIQSFSLSNLVNFVGSIYTGYEPELNFFSNSIFLFSLVILILIGFGYLNHKNNRGEKHRLFRYLIIWALAIPFFITLISYIKPIFLPRYLIFSTVGLLLLLIFIVEELPIPFRVGVVGLLIAVTLYYQGLQVAYRRKADLRKTIGEIKLLMSKGDKLYVSSEQDFFTAQYYLDENRVYVWGKTYQEIPDYVGKVLIPKQKVVRILPFYPNKAFVLTRDGNYTIQAAY